MNMLMSMLKTMGGSKGGGKGKGKRRHSMIGSMVKNHKDRVVWIGGLGEREKYDKEFNKQLQEFFNKKVEGCKFVQVNRNGTGAATFGTDDEAATAISTLNGIKFKGKKLEVDVWTKDE
jgi:RNA recognition motif-containing protein